MIWVEIRPKMQKVRNFYIKNRDFIDVVMAVADKNKQYRPSIDNLECQDQVIQVMKLCWSEDPHLRPGKKLFFNFICRYSASS